MHLQFAATARPRQHQDDGNLVLARVGERTGPTIAAPIRSLDATFVDRRARLIAHLTWPSADLHAARSTGGIDFQRKFQPAPIRTRYGLARSTSRLPAHRREPASGSCRRDCQAQRQARRSARRLLQSVTPNYIRSQLCLPCPTLRGKRFCQMTLDTRFRRPDISSISTLEAVPLVVVDRYPNRSIFGEQNRAAAPVADTSSKSAAMLQVVVVVLELASCCIAD